MKNPFITGGIALVILIVILGVIKYVSPSAFQNNVPNQEYTPLKIAVGDPNKAEIKTTEVTIADFDKTGWKTFTSDEYGFEIGMPANLIQRRAHDQLTFASDEKQAGLEKTREACSGSAHPGVCSGDAVHFELAFNRAYAGSWADLAEERVVINDIAWLKKDIQNVYYAQKQPAYRYVLEGTVTTRPYAFISEDEELLRKILSTYTMSLPFLSYQIDNYDSGELTVIFSAPKDVVKSQYYVSCVPGVIVFYSDNLTNGMMGGGSSSDGGVNDICGTTQNNTWDTVQPNPFASIDIRSMRAKNPTDKTKVVTFQMTSTLKDGTLLQSIPLEAPFIPGSF